MIFHFEFLPNWLICSVLRPWYFKNFSVAHYFKSVNSNPPTFIPFKFVSFSWYHVNITNQKWWNGYSIKEIRKKFSRFAFMFSLFVNLWSTDQLHQVVNPANMELTRPIPIVTVESTLKLSSWVSFHKSNTCSLKLGISTGQSCKWPIITSNYFNTDPWLQGSRRTLLLS